MSEAGPSQPSRIPEDEEAWQVSLQATTGDPNYKEVGYSVSGAMLWETTIGNNSSPQLYHLMHTPRRSKTTIILPLDSDESLKKARFELPIFGGTFYYDPSTRVEPRSIKELLISIMGSVESYGHEVKGKALAIEPDNATIQYETTSVWSIQGLKLPFASKSKSSPSGTLDEVSQEICKKLKSSMEETSVKAIVARLSAKRGFDLYRLNHNGERQLHLQCRVKKFNGRLADQVEAHLERPKKANDAKEGPDGSGIELTSIKVEYGDLFGPVETDLEGHADLH